MCGEMAKVIVLLIFLVMVNSITSADTVKYNPSDGYLINSNNFTSYKLTVPGSDPITIIESINSKPSAVQNDDKTATHTTSSDHDIESSLVHTKVMQKRNGERFSQKQLVSMISAEKQQQQQQQILLQRINDRNNDRKTSMNKTTNSSEPYQTKVKNFMNIYEDQQQQQQFDDDNDHDHYSASKNIEGGKIKHDYSPTLLHKFIKDYTEKIKYADQNTKDALSDIESTINQHKSTERSDIDQLTDDHIEEKYNNNNNNNWNDYHRKKLYQNQHKDQNPFNDKDGWVTLDAVPWSTSKVSKWHPNKDKFSSNNNYEDDDTPSGPPSYQQTFPRPPSPPPRPQYNNEDQGLDYSDNSRPSSSVTSFSSKPAIYTTYDQYRPISSDRPSYTKPQKYNYDSSSFNDRQPAYSSRPTRPHSYDNYHHSQYENNDRYPEYPSTFKPWSEDLITDTRPSNFPKTPPPPPPPRRPPTERPSAQAQDRFEYHPYSHPESGDGEWILVSTTKGYQTPSRHGQRAISFQHLIPTNNDITTVHKQVKLTVLPALSNNTFSYDDNRKPMKLSHGGMLEVESTFNTVDESVAAARRNDTMKPQKNGIKRKVYKALPLKSRISKGQDTSAVLAAVGAGMVPATVAMLMPFLGKKRKRSVDEQNNNKFI